LNNLNSTKDYFDSFAGEYSSKSHKGFCIGFRKKEEKAVLNAIAPSPGISYLELGCGSGYYTSLISKRSPSLLIAVDISQKMLKHLHVKKAKKVRADIQNVSFRQQFDRIICAGALEFLDDISVFLANMEGVLSTNGKMVLLLPRKGICGFFYKFFHSFHGVKVKLFTEKELKSVLVQGKWKLESLTVPTPMTYVLTVTNG
tara:strand:+ start:1173 stop:1775 length:603 start_codon:yes stop_codon:yes gene_type:complete